MNLSRRSEDEEIMDDLAVSGEVVHQTLRELDTINRWLGGNNISLGALRKIIQHQDNFSLADLGCGGGDLLKQIGSWAHKNEKEVRLTGVDANPFIIEYAKSNCGGQDNIEFKCCDILSQDFLSGSYDIIHCCLFTHHFNDEQLSWLFRKFKEMANLGVIVNDLHRHPLAYYGIKLLTGIFSRSSMVRYDAPLSVARGFRKKELVEIMRAAGIEQYSLSWHWAFRWKLEF